VDDRGYSERLTKEMRIRQFQPDRRNPSVLARKELLWLPVSVPHKRQPNLLGILGRVGIAYLKNHIVEEVREFLLYGTGKFVRAGRELVRRKTGI